MTPRAPSPKAAASVDKISGIALTAVFDSKPESGFPSIMDALSGSKGIDGRCKARPFEVLMLKTYLGIDAQYIARHTEKVSSCLNLGDLSKASPGNSPFVQAAPFLRCNDIRRLVFWRRG